MHAQINSVQHFYLVENLHNKFNTAYTRKFLQEKNFPKSSYPCSTETFSRLATDTVKVTISSSHSLNSQMRIFANEGKLVKVPAK